MMQGMMVTVRRGGCRRDTGDAAGAGITGVLCVVVIIVVIVRGVQRTEGLLIGGLGIFDQAILRLMRLLLQQAVYLEPIGAPAVARAGLGHAHHQALPQTTRFAGGTIFFVDHADAAILAFGDAAQIVVSAPEEGLCNRKRKRRALVSGGRLTICTFALLEIRRAEKSYLLVNSAVESLQEASVLERH